MIPKAIKGKDMTVFAGGQTAGYIDLAARIADKLPQMILIVVGLSFIVLMFAFRSLLVPLKAAIMNLLSVAAAYGVVTFVFQEGHGATLIGLDGAVPIASFVPLLMFAILFGLSMDYEVFLMTQIQEHYKEEGDAHEGGRRRSREHRPGDHLGRADHGLRLLELRAQRQPDRQAVRRRVGGGDRDRRDDRALSAVPAVMALMGDGAWWLPEWLDRILPPISIEGEDYFASATRRRRPSLPPRPPKRGHRAGRVNLSSGWGPPGARRGCPRSRGRRPSAPRGGSPSHRAVGRVYGSGPGRPRGGTTPSDEQRECGQIARGKPLRPGIAECCQRLPAE